MKLLQKRHGTEPSPEDNDADSDDVSKDNLVDQPFDGRAIEEINVDTASNVLLLCDHAGKLVPSYLNGLGINQESLDRHIGWDIGAAELTRKMAQDLGARAILNHVSRLVIDANRRPGTPGSMPEISDGCVVPANIDTDRDEVRQRLRHYFLPYHRRVSRAIAQIVARGDVPIVIAVHSFTPSMNGESRPWHVGILWRGDDRIANPVLESLRAQDGLVIGDNQPYSGFRAFGYSINFHAQRPHFPHIMFELRQDEIDTKNKAEHYATMLASILRPVLDDPANNLRYKGDNLAESGGLMSWRHASLVSP